MLSTLDEKVLEEAGSRQRYPSLANTHGGEHEISRLAVASVQSDAMLVERESDDSPAMVDSIGSWYFSSELEDAEP